MTRFERKHLVHVRRLPSTGFAVLFAATVFHAGDLLAQQAGRNNSEERRASTTTANNKKENTMNQLSTAIQRDPAKETAADAIRPFHVNFPQAALDDLRRRIVATRWPEREPVTDASQGVQLATMQKLARYWTTEYDWRRVEA